MLYPDVHLCELPWSQTSNTASVLILNIERVFHSDPSGLQLVFLWGHSSVILHPLQALFQFVLLFQHQGDGFRHRVRQATMLQIYQNWMLVLDYSARHADDRRAIRCRFDHDRTGADLHIISNCDGAQNDSTGADDDPAANGRMAFLLFQRGAAEDHALINQNVIANFRRLPNYHSGTMV